MCGQVAHQRIGQVGIDPHNGAIAIVIEAIVSAATIMVVPIDFIGVRLAS
jgi:hypothetical protein